MNDIIINSDITIPASSLNFKYSRSGGKGGQNVNKVSTRVELMVTIDSFSASDEIKAMIKKNLLNRLIAGNTLRIVSQQSRSQWENKRIAMDRLKAMVQDSIIQVTERKATKPSTASKQKRVDAKKKKGNIKSLRLKRITIDE